MAKKINKITAAGSSNILVSTITTGNGQYKNIFEIRNNGDIFYNFADEMVKVECPPDLSRAFLEAIHITSGTYDYEAYLLEKILDKDVSDDTLNKIEKIIRKRKLKKIL